MDNLAYIVCKLLKAERARDCYRNEGVDRGKIEIKDRNRGRNLNEQDV